jgi:hypothetical protein
VDIGQTMPLTLVTLVPIAVNVVLVLLTTNVLNVTMDNSYIMELVSIHVQMDITLMKPPKDVNYVTVPVLLVSDQTPMNVNHVKMMNIYMKTLVTNHVQTEPIKITNYVKTVTKDVPNVKIILTRNVLNVPRNSSFWDQLA